jgi:hypothetical protein
VNFPQKKRVQFLNYSKKQNQERNFLKEKKKEKLPPEKKKNQRRKNLKGKKEEKEEEEEIRPKKVQFPNHSKENTKKKEKEKRKKKIPPNPPPPRNGNENMAARSPTSHTKLQNRATPLRWNCHPFCRTASRAIELAIIGRAVVISRPSLPARHRPSAVPSVPVATTTRSLFHR